MGSLCSFLRKHLPYIQVWITTVCQSVTLSSSNGVPLKKKKSSWFGWQVTYVLFLETTTILLVCRKSAPHFNTQNTPPRKTGTWELKFWVIVKISSTCFDQLLLIKSMFKWTAFFKNCRCMVAKNMTTTNTVLVCTGSMVGAGWRWHVACRILVSPPGTESAPHWIAREVPSLS